MLLIVGGSRDHNISRLAEAAASRNAPYRVIHTDSDPAPIVHWDMARDHIVINGETFAPAGTSLFIRYDVFGTAPAAQTAAFYDTIKGWALAHPAVGLLNRRNESLEVSKPRALLLARDCGLQIPATVISNDFRDSAADCIDKGRIAKPVSGGSYTRPANEIAPDGQAYFVQEKLIYPELRLFRAGAHYFAFRVDSATLDCREDKDIALQEVTPPPALVRGIEQVSNRLGLDYAAADFKTDPRSGTFMFMEINSMPMFTGYDIAARGRLSDALFLTLRRLAKSAPQPSAAPHP